MDQRGFNISVANWSEELDKYKDMLSDEAAIVLLPALILFGVIMIVGALGNSLVLFVYYFKFKPSYIRTAILALAILDTITCILCIPGEILDMRYSFTYTSQISCKGQRLLTTAILMASGFILVWVAHDRYRRICYPLQEQATAKSAIKKILGSCIMATLLAIPAALVYGVAHVPTPTENIEGLECSSSETFRRHPLRMAYNLVLCVVFLVAFSAMAVYYVLIGRRVWHQEEFRDGQRKQTTPGRYRRSTFSNGESGGEHDLSSSDGVIADGSKVSSVTEKVDALTVYTHPKSQSPASPTSSTTPSRKPSFSHHIRKVSKVGRDFIYKPRQGSAINNSSVNSWRIRKTTFMLFIITLIFFISFLPHLALKATQAIHSSLLKNLTPSEAVAYNIMVRSCFFNAATNWAVYGLCSPKFRSECRNIFRGITSKTLQKDRTRRPSRIGDEVIW
ncbi:cholecystokinin receptor [Plakobranchus ocellatus]|uniref:Cholecystokinin receptor n=1 Tax=Plakobranchus ocellatus TaxID=259542 RepID=A0AAV4CQS5_9GAST|nr:cholecystokinin receptor [Plakobranchus ocellatus]